MLESIKEEEFCLETKENISIINETELVLIYEDFILEDLIKNDLQKKYEIRSLLYDSESFSNMNENVFCFIVDESVYNKRKGIIKEINDSYPESKIILVASGLFKQENIENIENIEYIFTMVQEYEKNKLTLFLAVRNAMASFDSKALFDKHIQAFENYSFYLRENDLLNPSNVIKNLNNYFNLVSNVKHEFNYIAIEHNHEDPTILGGSEHVLNEFKKKESKEMDYIKSLYQKTIEQQVSLNCEEYNTFYHSDLNGNIIVFILQNSNALSASNKRICDLLIGTAINFLFVSINERKKMDIHLEGMLKLNSKINDVETERNLSILHLLFQDIEISILSQRRIVFFYLTNSIDIMNGNIKNESSFFDCGIVLNREEQDVFNLFNLIRNKERLLNEDLRRELTIPPHLLQPVLNNYFKYNLL